jgi:PAS domain S-box-containing protein
MPDTLLALPPRERETLLWRHAVGAHQRLVFLTRVNRVLEKSRDTHDLLARLARVMVPTAGDWCVVDVVGEEGRPELAAVADVEPRNVASILELRRRFPLDPATHPVCRVLRTKRPLIVRREVDRHLRAFASSREHLARLRRLSPGTFVCVPLRVGDRIVAVLSFGRAGTRAFTSADLALGRDVAARAGLAISRRRAEEALERQRREQQEILDAVPAMIWYKDRDNRVLRCNRAAADWYGRPQAEIEGKSADELFGQRGRAYREDDLAVIQSGRARLGLIEECRSPSGRRFWMRRDILPRFDERGRTAGVIIFAVDITDIHLAQESLRESERAQREFVANVSHEFRTPVAAIKGFAETLRRGGLEDVKNRGAFVRTIESHADRLDWLVSDLLDLARLGSGLIKLSKAKLPARRFLRHYVESVAPLLARKDVRVEIAAPPRLCLRADRPHLVQVLDNLVSNALKYSPRGGKIRVEARRWRGRTRLSVRDQGPGIAAAHLPRLFDRFYRVEKGDGGGSTGLGLHIVKTIVEGHGGRVWAQSEPGAGSAFHLTLPG